MITANLLTVEDAARSLPDLVDRIQAGGEPAVLFKCGRPVARIVAVPVRSPDELIAFLRQWRIEHPEPDEQFGEAINDSRKCAATA